MPDTAEIQCNGPVLYFVNTVAAVVGKKSITLDKKYVYGQDTEKNTITVPRWLAEEKDIEEHIVGGKA